MPGEDYIRDLRPPEPRGSYEAALAQLRASSATLIAHIDAGVWPHMAFGWDEDDVERPPAHILLDRGANFHDPERDARPLASLRYSGDGVARLVEYPDHGVKTLSAILGETEDLRGVAPGVKVVPYRVSNGPLFRDGAGPMLHGAGGTAPLGAAIRHAVMLDPPVRVISISMGNPGWLGVWDFLVRSVGGVVGMDRATGEAVDLAYEAGAIIVCAGGQVIDRVVYPARYSRTIGVGGFDRRGATYAHYPAQGYDLPERIDVWAQAARVNRASFLLDATPPEPVFADDPLNEEREPSGTSYAAPQVAAAAALWVERHRDILQAKFAGARWKIVESFRRALRETARPAEASLLSGRKVPIRALDIPALLGRAPPDITGEPAPRAAGQGFW